MENGSRDVETASISRLKTEWDELEGELSSRFAALSEHLHRAEQGQVDPAEAAEVMRSEIDTCLDRLIGIKAEITAFWQQR